MKDALTAITVHVAPGPGRVARREQSVLFDPSGESVELVAAFDAADSCEAAITAVKQQLIESEFSAAPVVVIDWRGQGLGMLVFGDVAAHSSVPAAPMINGSGSGTWIERHLGALELASSAEAAIWSGDEVDEATDLRLGVVRGGGVRVGVVRTASPGVETDHADDAEDPDPSAEAKDAAPSPGTDVSHPIPVDDAPTPASEAAPAAAPKSTLGHEPTVPLRPAAEIVEPVGAEIPPPEPEEANPRPVPAPAPSDFEVAALDAEEPEDDVLDGADTGPKLVPSPPSAAPAAHSNGSAAAAEPEPAGAVATMAEPLADPFTDDGFDDQVTEPAERVAGLAEVRAGAGLIEAILCSNGHSNPPQFLICRCCAVDIDPATELTLIPQPSVGHLRFMSGEVLEVDAPHVIGRKPPTDDPLKRPFTVDHAEVSRTHVEVTYEGWAVLVTDLGSSNGTWVVPPSDPTPVRLEAEVPYLLEHGTTVHLGGPDAGFSYDFGTD